MYNIKPFLIHDIDNYAVIQNGISTTIITNMNLINFLKKIEEKRIQKVTQEDIETEFNVEYENVLDFLLQNKIILEEHEIRQYNKKINFLTNNDTFKELMSIICDDSDLDIKFTNINNRSELIFDSDATCIVFLNPFNLSEYIDLCNQLITANIIFKTSFYYNHSLYISNFYKKEWYNPCPKCFFYSLETQLRGNVHNNNMNFQTIVDVLYTKKPKFCIQADLHVKDLLLLTHILYNQIVSCHNETMNEVYEISLLDFKVNTDDVYHWEMCDCYE